MPDAMAQAVVAAPGQGLQTVQTEGANLAMPVAGAALGIIGPITAYRSVDAATMDDAPRLGARAVGGVAGLGLAMDGIRKYKPGDSESLTEIFVGVPVLAESVVEGITMPLNALGGKSAYQSAVDWVASLLPKEQGDQVKKTFADGWRGFGPIYYGGRSGVGQVKDGAGIVNLNPPGTGQVKNGGLATIPPGIPGAMPEGTSQLSNGTGGPFPAGVGIVDKKMPTASQSLDRNKTTYKNI